MYQLRRMVVREMEIFFTTAEVARSTGRALSVWTARLTGMERCQVDELATALAKPAGLEMEDIQGDLYVSPIIATSELRRKRGGVSFEFVALFRFVSSAFSTE